MKSLAAILVLLALLSFSLCVTKFGTVFLDSKDTSKFVFRPVYNPNGVALAVFEETSQTKGWMSLHLKTSPKTLPPSWSPSQKDRAQSFAAGYLEGILTSEKIYSHFKNMEKYTWNSEPSQKMPETIKRFFSDQRAWIEEVIKRNAGDKYYEQVAAMHNQYLGLVEGYNSVQTESEKQISYEEMMVINAFGDLFDIPSNNNLGLRRNSRKPFLNMTEEELREYIIDHDHCSALIRLTEDRRDLIFAHNSWFTYASLTKIWKTYEIALLNEETATKTVRFTSYAGCLSSNDDFLISDKLFAMETTNNVFNEELYKRIVPQALSCWMRSMIATRMGKDTESWINAFKRHNSGTYNNQYTVMDLAKFVPGMSKLPEKFIQIAEQIPGEIVVNDVTGILNSQKFWPSFNVPYSGYVRKVSGYPEMLQKHPQMEDTIDYEKCARNRIFSRDAKTVKDIETMKKMIRYNDFTRDPLSKNDPGLTISSRFDLRTPGKSGRKCDGALDAKVSSYSAWRNGGEVHLIFGPANENVPQFRYEDGYCSVKESSHLGIPVDFSGFEWNKF